MGIYFLDTVSGELELVCDSKNELEKIFNSQEGQDHYLMSELVLLAREQGLVFSDGECYDFIVSPVLSGAIEFDNLQKMDFKVSLHVGG